MFDYRAYREYIEALKVKNQLVRDRLKEVHDREEAQRAHLVIEMNEVGCCSIVVVIFFFCQLK